MFSDVHRTPPELVERALARAIVARALRVVRAVDLDDDHIIDFACTKVRLVVDTFFSQALQKRTSAESIASSASHCLGHTGSKRTSQRSMTGRAIARRTP
jgi:hypothetical protein